MTTCELNSIFLTSSLTIAGGVIVFVLSQWVLKFIIEPIHRQKELFGKIDETLVYYANIYSNPLIFKVDKLNNVSRKIRKLATQLKAKTMSIPWYGFLQSIRVVVHKDDVVKAAKELMGLSNSLRPYDKDIGEFNSKIATRIRNLLQLSEWGNEYNHLRVQSDEDY